MHINRIVAAATAIAVGTGLLVATAPASEAATATINNANRTHAPDIKSKGVVKTPTTKTSGVQVASRAYVIYKGKKVVARTSTQGKAYKLAPGTYTVKSSMKYRTVSTEEVDGGTRTVWTPASGLWSSIGDSDTRDFNPKVTNHDDDSVIDFHDCTFENRGQHWDYGTCPDNYGHVWQGEFSTAESELRWSEEHNSSHYWTFEATGIQTDEFLLKKVKVYGPWKTVTKTQKVTITKNSGVMTYYEYKKVKNKMKYSKVKSIVGGSGEVVDRWSWGSDDYVIRDYNGHWVYFEDGRVYGKDW